MNFSSLGSAEGDSDYTSVFLPVTIPETNVQTPDFTQCVDVNITDDSVFEEPTETFTVTLNSTYREITLINNNIVFTITDNEGQFDHA